MPKVVIPSALTRRNKFSGHSEIFSTRSWFEFCPDFKTHLKPGDEFEISLKSFARAIPMPVPTMGRCDVVYRAFFIPYDSVMKSWHDFKANTVHYFGDGQTDLVPMVRRFSYRVLCDFFALHSDAASDDAPADYVDYNGVRRVVNDVLGRRFFKLLYSLGYRFIGVADNAAQAAEFYFNALPLLCAIRVYMDYYWPSQFRQTAAYIKMSQALLTDDPDSLELTVPDFSAFAGVTFSTCYDDNLFTDSFVQPIGPNNPFNNIVLSDPTNSSSVNRAVTSNTGNNTPVSQSRLSGSTVASAVASVSQWQITALQRLTQYMKRNQLAGSLAYERMLARFGLSIHNDCSKFIGSYLVPVNIGDVMSQTDNFDAATDTGASLGSYAGKAMAFDPRDGEGYFKFRAPDFGMFMVVCSVIPRVGYYQGVDRHCLHLTPLQFFEPEFDGLSPQAINACEVFTPQCDDPLDTPTGFKISEAQSVFGFAPSNYEWKVWMDNVIGDYIMGSKNAGLDAYHLLRRFVNGSFVSYQYVKQDVNFAQAGDWTQYNRMFGQEVTGETDQRDILDGFRVRSIYNIVLHSDMRSLYDDIDFDQLQHNAAGKSDFNVSSAKLN